MPTSRDSHRRQLPAVPLGAHPTCRFAGDRQCDLPDRLIRRRPVSASGSRTAALETALHRQADAMVEFATALPLSESSSARTRPAGTAYGLPWTVQTWLHGDVATPDGLSTSKTFASDIARLIDRSEPRTPVAGRSTDRVAAGGSQIRMIGWRGVRRKARVCWTSPDCSRSGTASTAASGDVTDTMSHKDLIPANLLVRGQHIVGILDCGDFGPADPALDLVAAMAHARRTVAGDVRSALDSPADEWLRGAAWAFVQAIGIVWYYRNTNPGMSALGRSTLDRLMADDDAGRGRA